MISIIVCSRTPDISTLLSANIHNTVGCEYELVIVDNSDNKFSICEAYNLGVQKSKYPVLCFVHEDVEFITKNWGIKAIECLCLAQTGFVGVAGGKAALKVPYGWSTYLPTVNIIHSYVGKNNKRIEEREFSLRNDIRDPQEVVLLDGVFLCAYKKLFTEIKFDESIGGFHCYDLDISMAAFNKGYTNLVTFDIELKHFSKGKFGKEYINALLLVHEKWENNLPFIERNIVLSSKEYKNLERKTLSKLKKRLIRAGFKSNNIKPIVNKYINNTGNWFDKIMFHFLPLEIFVIKNTSIWRKKMIE